LTKLDIRCGHVKSVKKVENSDKLYLVQVDIGDETRQVTTGLQTHYKEADLNDRRVIVYCNIKPCKMAGHESQAMILAATTGKGTDKEVCELLDPPKNAAVGTRPLCGDLEVGSQSAGVNVKNISKSWNVVQPLLLADAKGQATFSGTTITFAGAPITTGSLRAGASIS
jgi:methionine--tRNA ligase beta chain